MTRVKKPLRSGWWLSYKYSYHWSNMKVLEINSLLNREFLKKSSTSGNKKDNFGRWCDILKWPPFFRRLVPRSVEQYCRKWTRSEDKEKEVSCRRGILSQVSLISQISRIFGRFLTLSSHWCGCSWSFRLECEHLTSDYSCLYKVVYYYRNSEFWLCL